MALYTAALRGLKDLYVAVFGGSDSLTLILTHVFVAVKVGSKQKTQVVFQ